MGFNKLLCFLSTATILTMAVPAHAGFISAWGWVSTESVVQSATPASLALSTCSHGTAACTFANADVTFTTNGLGFSTVSTDIATWLASNTSTLASLVDNAPNSPMDPTIWEFTGNASFTSPDPFTIAHDDGVTFTVDGQVVVNDAGPSSGATTNGTYTGPAGNSLPFQIIYAECCGFSATLQTTLVGPANPPGAPEPSSIALMAGGILGVILTRRKVHCK